MNPITSISSLSGDLLIVVIAGLLFIEETGIPIPFAPGDLLLLIAGIAIASDTVEPVPMVATLLVAITVGAMVGREVFALVGLAALQKAADALHFRGALDRATHMLRRGGARAVFVGRLFPGLRISTTQVAGVSRMPRLTFALGLVPSVLIYTGVFVGLGALVGQPAVSLFHRAEHRLFVLIVAGLAAVAVILSVRTLARRGVLATMEPIVLGVRRDMADAIEAALPWQHGADARWRQYPLVRRLWAGLIDLLLIVAATVYVLTAVTGVARNEALLDPEGVGILIAITLLYRIPLEARSGQTVGKRMMGISVYGPAGGVPGWWRAVIRNLLGIIPPLWAADAVLLVVGRRRQRASDIATATTVRRVAH
ncbi:MAG: RDD family protein [Candidatus Dormibacteraeota bacterium]|nr:RDD family protein [Candidatus Dormibacteraeota bacterium]